MEMIAKVRLLAFYLTHTVNTRTITYLNIWVRVNLEALVRLERTNISIERQLKLLLQSWDLLKAVVELKLQHAMAFKQLELKMFLLVQAEDLQLLELLLEVLTMVFSLEAKTYKRKMIVVLVATLWALEEKVLEFHLAR